MPGTLPTDLHQHLLPEALIAALARRSEAPRLARDRLVHGSDRPVVAPGSQRFGGAVEHATRVVNPQRVLA